METSQIEFSTLSTENSVENVENYVYFPREMNISHKTKGFEYAFMHISPFLYVENF